MANVVGPTGQNGYYLGPVTIDLTASEANVPPSSLTTQYSVNNGPLTTGNHIVLTDNGTDVVRYFSTDSSGNVEPTQSLTVHIDQTNPRLTEMASPTQLWPPNHKLDTVNVRGTAIDTVSGINGSRVTYFVRDEYGQVQPRGSAEVDSSGHYSFRVQLQASRSGQDHDGRQYTIFVVAQSGAGRTATQSVVVTVPHDQGHSGGFGSGSTGDGGDDQGSDSGNQDQGDQGHGNSGHGNSGHGNSGSRGHGGGHGNKGHHGSGKGHGHG